MSKVRRVPRVSDIEALAHRGKGLAEHSAWYRLQRRLSLRITWLLLHTPLSANQVSVGMILLAVVAGILAASGSVRMAIVATAAAYGSYLLDRVDGEIARVRHQESWNGVYLDWLYHRLAPTLLHAGFLIGIARQHPSAASISAAALIGPLLLLIKENSQVVYNLYPRKQGAAPDPEPVARVGGDSNPVSWPALLVQAPLRPDLAPGLYFAAAMVDWRIGSQLRGGLAVAVLGLAALLLTRQILRLGRGGLAHEIARLPPRPPPRDERTERAP